MTSKTFGGSSSASRRRSSTRCNAKVASRGGMCNSEVTQRPLEARMNPPPIVPAQEWKAAHEQLLVKEKELTRARDALAAERRRMPWLAVEKEYEFEGPEGKVNLLGLFQGRRQLIVYRAFFEPGVHGWP